MSPFEFVSVFFAVVLGLAVAHVMGGISDLVEVRSRVRFYWVHAVWVALVFILEVQVWWGMWGLRSAERWSFLSFFGIVAMLGTLYLLSTLLIPHISGGEEPIDLARHFFGVHRTFFGVLAAYFILSVVINRSIFAMPLVSPTTLIPGIGAALAIAGSFSRNRIFHAAYALVTAAGIVGFIIADTTTLR
jgi:hypothetical protein